MAGPNRITRSRLGLAMNRFRVRAALSAVALLGVLGGLPGLAGCSTGQSVSSPSGTAQSGAGQSGNVGAAGNPNPAAISIGNVRAYSRTHGLINQWNFLTGSLAELKATWTKYNIAVQIERDEIDHTPALFVIDQQGRERKLYLTAMAYSSVGQSAQVLAEEISGLLPGHPKVASQQSLASISGQGPSDHLTLPSASPQGGTVALGPGQPRLVMFFATWLDEVANLKSELTGMNAYVAAARRAGLPPLVAGGEAGVERSV